MTQLYGLLLAALIACSPSLAQAACNNDSSAPKAVVLAQHKAYAAHDIDAFAACYSDDVIITFLSSDRKPVIGIAALRARYGKRFKLAPKGFHSEYLNEIANGPIVVVLERLVDGRAGWPKKDVAMFEVRNGKIVHVWFPPYK